jgi:hypothetical protein
MIGFIHDEIIPEAPEVQAEEAAPKLQQIMEKNRLRAAASHPGKSGGQGDGDA